MQSEICPASLRRRGTAGFSLIELMVVILIIALISGLVITAVGGGDDARAVESAISRLHSVFSLARSAAITQKQTTRVLINFNPNEPDKFLRYVTIVTRGDDGIWRHYIEGEFLPEGVYFTPAMSSSTVADTSPLQTWLLNINPSTLAITQPADANAQKLSPQGPYSLQAGGDPLSHVPAPSKWYAYEFAPNGTFTNPLARVVVTPGILNLSDKRILIPEPNPTTRFEDAMGFVIFRSGKGHFFQSAAQIAEGN